MRFMVHLLQQNVPTFAPVCLTRLQTGPLRHDGNRKVAAHRLSRRFSAAPGRPRIAPSIGGVSGDPAPSLTHHNRQHNRK
jgi:hypothetical protein